MSIDERKGPLEIQPGKRANGEASQLTRRVAGVTEKIRWAAGTRPAARHTQFVPELRMVDRGQPA